MTPVPPQQSAERQGVQTPLEDLVQRALDKMASGEWRLILEHPNPAQGTSVACVEVGQEIARRAADLTRLNAKVEELERDRNEWEAKAISLFWACPDATKVGDVQKLKAKADSLLAAEAQVADLSARLARAVEVMRPFAEYPIYDPELDDAYQLTGRLNADGSKQKNVTAGDFRRVRAFLCFVDQAAGCLRDALTVCKTPEKPNETLLDAAFANCKPGEGFDGPQGAE